MAPRRVQNLFCTNIVMLHIKSKVIKSRIQWCKNFATGGMCGGHQRSKSGFGVLFFIVTTPPRLFELEL